jgi:hypothetical protein
MAVVPPDTSTIYAAGNARISAYQTSGLHLGQPMAGQGDSFSVNLSAQEITPQTLDGLMARMSQATADIPGGSTGTLVAINQKDNGKFSINVGIRGDSPALIVKIDKNGAVKIIDLFDQVENPTFNEFGEFSLGDQNSIGSIDVKINEGEKMVLVAASDGLSEAYLLNKNKAGKSPREFFNDALQQQIAQALEKQQDVATALTTNALKTGHEDNTTVLAVTLTPDTNLGKKSVVLGVFDGLGHDDNRTSSQLARLTGEILPHAHNPEILAHSTLPHLGQPGGVQTQSRFVIGGTAQPSGDGFVAHIKSEVKTEATPPQPPRHQR